MKKKIYYLLVCVMAVLSGAYFVSCSSDSDGGSSNPLVGTWYSDYDDSYSGTDREYVMFCSDGTMYVFEECSKHGAHVEMMKYSYDEETQIITVIEDDRYTSRVQVLSIDSKSLTVRSSSNRTETYKKTKSPYSASQLKKYYLADLEDSSY